MPSLRWLSALFVALALVAGAAWWLQRQSAAQLRGELALLRDEHGKLATLRAENAKLVAAQPPAAELERLRADRAAIVQMRGEIEKLKTETDAKERSVGGGGVSKPSLIPASNWKNAGRATPAAAVETYLWAAAHHDIDAIAAMLSFQPNLRPALDGMFESLPESFRAQHGTVERMLADYMTRDLPLAAMRIVTEPRPDAEWGALAVYLEDKEGFAKETAILLAHGEDGWRPAVNPKQVQEIANRIGGELKAARAAK